MPFSIPLGVMGLFNLLSDHDLILVRFPMKKIILLFRLFIWWSIDFLLKCVLKILWLSFMSAVLSPFSFSLVNFLACIWVCCGFIFIQF